MKEKNKKGFTIIELIVVIAIVAVLAAIVMVAVTQSASKSRDAAIKENMHSLAIAGAKYFQEQGSYVGFTVLSGNPDYAKIYNGVARAGSSLIGGSDTNAWAACAGLVYRNGYSWCVDSSGKKKEISNSTCSWLTLFYNCEALP